ncbi:uncharacterized protein FIBRA_03448 [Fibroporia radiculosa]|uniref:LsmAD domain-containing protein n=1 Tax=Fibroporia radiculosa TaxID=599839 RepID=J4HW00_9APHY|nr:uncharacterized protein FIBRA_03448 [Fibroporia radiculosa]CCM01397.1 predicted protein [Fibroporia radiculosa]
MAATARQPKPQRKGMPDPAAPRRNPAWTGTRTFSPGASNARLPNGVPPASPGPFPPLGQQNGASSTPPPRADKDVAHDRVLSQLSGLIGTTITLLTKTHVRYEGSVSSTSGEGDTTGVTLRDVKDLTNPGAPLKDQFFIASTNIEQWSSGPADAKAPAVNGDSFKTDTDISNSTAARRERELQAWQPTDDPASGVTPTAPLGSTANGGGRDEMTFGPAVGATGGWDQFAANEQLFGVRANFDEDVYTTKLDRSAPDYKEKERRAAVIANEILQSTTNNVHIAEERTQNFAGENGSNEEEKYGAVVRGANAYVPPGARKANPSASTAIVQSKQDVPKVSVNAPDGSTVSTDKPAAPANTPPPKTESPAPGGTKPAADAVPAFRDFVSNEKDRLMKKKQAIMKSEMDKRMAELVKFSKSFKLNKPIPDDLVPILAKDEEKQRIIREKSTKDAESSHARAIGVSNATSSSSRAPDIISTIPPSAKPAPAQPAIAKEAANTQKAPAQSKPGVQKGRISMVIQSIPPFKGKRTSTIPAISTGGAASGARSQGILAPAGATSPLSPTAANRLNVNASSFRPNVKSVSPPSGSPNPNGTPSSTASPKTKPADGSSSPQTQGPPNPFFGTRLPKKVPLVHIKDDFNPFKYHKVVEAAHVGPMWQYSGKRYMQMFPPMQTPPQPQSPPMAHPLPPPVPPPSYEDDTAAQVTTRGYMYYPQYYPGQMQMMPGGMVPPPPGPYMPGPHFMPPMPYPHMPPNAMYSTAPMGQMPTYMPPPGAYPPPNGAAPRPSMPPTPIPSHAHPYYHQSPQLQHTVPYPMMMPPPGPPPHPYDGSQAPPVQMGGHA